MVDDARDSSGETTEAAGEAASQPQKSDVGPSWTKRALSRPGPNSPFYTPPAHKGALRLALIMLYFAYVGLPIIGAAVTTGFAISQFWFGAGMCLLATVWWCYRGWNGLRGRTPYGGEGLLALRQQLKE
jgi:hypothetical protein